MNEKGVTLKGHASGKHLIILFGGNQSQQDLQQHLLAALHSCAATGG
jgi:hypothetical protein